MYHEPDWSSLTVSELLEKAQVFGIKAYSSSMSTFAFLDRACEASPKHSTTTIEILELAEKTQRAYQLLAEVNRGIARFTSPPGNDTAQSNAFFSPA